MSVAMSKLHASSVTVPCLWDVSLPSPALPTISTDPRLSCPNCDSSHSWSHSSASPCLPSTAIQTDDLDMSITNHQHLSPSLCIDPSYPLWIFSGPSSSPLSSSDSTFTGALRQVSHCNSHSHTQFLSLCVFSCLTPLGMTRFSPS